MDLRALCVRAAEEAASFRAGLGDRRILPTRDYAASVSEVSEELPIHGMAPIKVIDELVARVEPGLMGMASPRFHGWVIGGSHPLGVAADFLTSAWGQNAGNHMATPSAAAIELIAGRWLIELLGLPETASIGFVTGATMANFTCLAAARSAVLEKAGWDADRQGLFGAPPVTVIIGDDAHTTVFSALQFLGFGHDRVLRVPADDQGQMIAAEFERLTGSVGVEGPIIVVLQAGQLNTGGFDPFQTIIPAAHEKGAWVHVDGAFGLWAQASKTRRGLSQGVELADSWATDGHKWLQTPYDCGYAIVRDEAAHRRAMTIAASYLPAAGADERDPSHYVPELSRRARGFATWALIKHLGREGIAEMVERNCAAARMIADAVAGLEDVAILNDIVLNQVVVRFGASLPIEDGDRLTERTIFHLQEDGEAFAGGAKWRGRLVMRISVTNYQTDEREAERTIAAIDRAYGRARSQG